MTQDADMESLDDKSIVLKHALSPRRLKRGKILHNPRAKSSLSNWGFSFTKEVFSMPGPRQFCIQQKTKNDMSDPRAFISFDFDNNKVEKDLFAGQAKNSRTPFNIEDWSSKEHLPQNQWEKLINEKVSRCNMLIVLVGRNASQAKGVEKEIAFAIASSVPIFGVYVDNAGLATPLPNGLSRSRTISWDWSLIASWVDKCMKEGKNS